MEKNVIEVRNLRTYFFTEEGVVHGVDGVDFSVKPGKTLAIVGESGCGKSVTALSILRIIQSPPGKIMSGEIIFEGMDLLKLTEKEMRSIRGNKISMIFQEPMTSLNPVFTVGWQIMQALRFHQKISKRDAKNKAIEMIHLVGIPDPERIASEYPHQLSGGMRQRIMIAMAFACDPKVLIADEPTTALDVTIQAQILNLMSELKKKLNTSVILITHDLGIVAQIADEVIVMYAGQAVEYAPMADIYRKPCHPYTQGLLESLPKINVVTERLYTIPGSVPSAVDFPDGCRFYERCPKRMDICKTIAPQLIKTDIQRSVRCHLYR